MNSWLHFPGSSMGCRRSTAGAEPLQTARASQRNFVPAAVASGPVDNRPGKIEERRIAAEKARRQAEHPTWNGLSVNEFEIVGPHNYTKAPSAQSTQRIFTCNYSNKTNQPPCIRKIISELATRAFRRPRGWRSRTIFDHCRKRATAQRVFRTRRFRGVSGHSAIARFPVSHREERHFRRRAATHHGLRARLTPLLLPLEQHAGTMFCSALYRPTKKIGG